MPIWQHAIWKRVNISSTEVRYRVPWMSCILGEKLFPQKPMTGMSEAIPMKFIETENLRACRAALGACSLPGF